MGFTTMPQLADLIAEAALQKRLHGLSVIQTSDGHWQANVQTAAGDGFRCETADSPVEALLAAFAPPPKPGVFE